MIETPYPLDESLYSLRNGDMSDDVAASLGALHLGCAQMMYPADEWVYQQFSSDTELKWPTVLPASEGALDDSDLLFAEKLARSISGLQGSDRRGAFTYFGLIKRDLFGLDPFLARRAAMALTLGNISHPHPLVRVSAAVAALSFVRRPLRVGQAVNVLSQAYAEIDDELIQQLAFSGLARSFSKGVSSVAEGLGAGLARFMGRQSPPTSLLTSNSALLVHGTVFQKHGKPLDEWWRPPSGDLYQYLKSGARPNLYSGMDHFRWSGGWSDYAREEAAEKLVDWLSHRGLQDPDVIAHSHGCNVSMLASHVTPLNKLVLLSCPVHWSSYRPGLVNDVVSIRINWDLVIMADGGAQRFPSNSGIREKILPFWFTAHDATHHASTWKARKLDALI